jgi:hypothetical protein
VLLLTAIAGVLVLAGVASATTITEPARLPIVTQRDTRGLLAPVTVSATGFEPGTSVYIEQCDGKSPSAPQWSPTLDCDLGTSTSPAIADASGAVVFRAGDGNRTFRPFTGESPQSSFNCVARQAAAPPNGLPNFDTCQIRVSSNNSSATSDQVFAPLVLAAEGKGTAPAVASALTSAPTTAPTTLAPSPKSAANTTTTTGTMTEAKAAGTARGVKVTTSSVAAKCDGARCAAGRTARAASTGGAGLASVNNSGVATGWVLMLAGLLIVALAIARARRRVSTRRS